MIDRDAGDFERFELGVRVGWAAQNKGVVDCLLGSECWEVGKKKPRKKRGGDV